MSVQDKRATLAAVLDAVEAWHHRAHPTNGAFAACPLDPCSEVVYVLATASGRPRLRLIGNGGAAASPDPLPRRALLTEKPVR